MSIDADNVVSNTSFLEKETDQENEELDILQTAETQLKYALEKSYTKDRLAKQIKFNAVCLYKLENKLQEHKDLVRVKARVPELHSLIPKPTSTDDYPTIALYPTYVGLKTSFNPTPGDGSDAIAPGTTLVVTYGNVSNFSDPLLLEIGKLTGAEAAAGSNWRIPDLGETRGSKTVREVSSSIAGFKTEASVFTHNTERDLKKVSFIVLHDSDTSNRANMLRALNSRGALGTHFSVGGGSKGIAKYQYADLTRVTSHSTGMNDISLGLDVINKPVWYNGSTNEISKRREAAIAALKLAEAQATAGSGVSGLFKEFERRAKVLTGIDPSDYSKSITSEQIKFDFLKPLADAMALPTFLIIKHTKASFNIRNYKEEPFYLDTIGNLIKGGTSKRLEKIIDIDTLDATYEAIKKIIFSDQLKAVKGTSILKDPIRYNGQFVPGRSALKAITGTGGNIGFPAYDEKTKVWTVGVSVSADNLVSGKNSQGVSYAGIVAHGSFESDRTDGRVAELYTFLRIRKAFGQKAAYITVKGIFAAIGARDKAKDLGIFDSNYKLQGKYKNMDTWKAFSSAPGGRPIPKDAQIQQLINFHQESTTKALYGLGAYPSRIFKMEIK